jgi:hypothetical protein
MLLKKKVTNVIFIDWVEESSSNSIWKKTLLKKLWPSLPPSN